MQQIQVTKTRAELASLGIEDLKNEFSWNRVEQTTERSLTGALMVQEGQLVHGRSIVHSGNGEAGWVSRLTVKSLFALQSG